MNDQDKDLQNQQDNDSNEKLDKNQEEISTQAEVSKENKPQVFELNYENDIPDIDQPNENLIKQEKRKMSSGLKITLIGLIIVAISVSLAMGIIFVAQDIYGFNKVARNVTIEIPKGAGSSRVAEILKEQGFIKSELLFKVYCKLSNHEGTIYPGIYTELTQNMSYEILLSELSKYDSKESVSVTFPEGFTLDQIAKRLKDNKVCDADAFIKVVNETQFNIPFINEINVHELRYYKLEGFLYPDTYEFFVGDNPANVAKKMLDNFQEKVINANADLIKNSGKSLDEIVTLASIVQAEAPVKTEMDKVSSIFYNRLKNPADFANKLQSDPTRKYAEAITKKMQVINKEMVTAYNTYEGTGLPPGPICNPGQEAILASLQPAETDYYYFCTNLKTQQFFYAKTLAQHNANLRKAGLR